MTPFVSVIIPHHLSENQPYLNLAVESVMASEGVDFECLIVADTKEIPFFPEKKNLRCVADQSLDNAGKKVNKAVKHWIDHKTTHILMMSDDVMIAKHTLATMASVFGDVIQNPMSNSDNRSQFVHEMPYPIKMDIVDLKSPGDIINFPRYPIIVAIRPWVSFYCTMIPKNVWDKVGELDLDLDCRGNDVDYCMRAEKIGVPSAINFGAFALHFGDKTLPFCTTKEDLDECSRKLQEKWANT